MFLFSENYEDMLVLAELGACGKLAPVPDRMYSLAEDPEAIQYFEEKYVRRKVATPA